MDADAPLVDPVEARANPAQDVGVVAVLVVAEEADPRDVRDTVSDGLVGRRAHETVVTVLVGAVGDLHRVSDAAEVHVRLQPGVRVRLRRVVPVHELEELPEVLRFDQPDAVRGAGGAGLALVVPDEVRVDGVGAVREEPELDVEEARSDVLADDLLQVVLDEVLRGVGEEVDVHGQRGVRLVGSHRGVEPIGEIRCRPDVARNERRFGGRRGCRADQ